jgi:DEAD/DEAH box helicase domain-containing protein
MTELLSRNITLAEIRYSDRYLRSPLVLLLLRSLIGALSEFPGGLSENTRLSIKTTQLERVGTDQPRRLYHDWRDNEDRREVVKSWFGKDFANFQWDAEYATSELPHERKLELIWVDGAQCKIILDQGVGYWRIIQGIRSEFPFDSDVMQQINWINKANVLVEAISKTHATHWYCGYYR